MGALAILTTALRKLGADVRPFIPHRLHDGYGLRAPTLRRALEQHDPEGIVTVDCGITAVETVAEATGRGVYVVVTDHHLPPAALPEGAVLVDPKLPGCRYPFKELCGAGLAWKLAEALFIHSGERVGMDAPARRRWLASLAKIAAISTVADMVPLTGENRVLVSWGLSGLADPRAPGLAALLRRAGVPAGRAPSTREVAFRIAPRLNAMGRLDHAARAFELLTTSDAARAEVLADEIEAANDERREVQQRVVDAVLTRLAGRFDPARDAIVVEAGEAADGWHRGVLGIAASRVAKELARPVLLLAREGDVVSGSGRTHGKTPLFERLAPVARRYTSEFGGHAAALGLTLPAASFEAFRDDLRAAFAEARDEEEWAEELLVDTEAEAPEADDALARALERLEPHGQENPKPLLAFPRTGMGRPRPGRGRAGAARLALVEREARGGRGLDARRHSARRPRRARGRGRESRDRLLHGTARPHGHRPRAGGTVMPRRQVARASVAAAAGGVHAPRRALVPQARRPHGGRPRPRGGDAAPRGRRKARHDALPGLPVRRDPRFRRPLPRARLRGGEVRGEGREALSPQGRRLRVAGGRRARGSCRCGRRARSSSRDRAPSASSTT